MHSDSVRMAVLALVEAGENDCAISRSTGVPRRTVRDMRLRAIAGGITCPRCWRRSKPMRFEGEDYAELLGFYLGDGCISKLPRTYSLRISLDGRYPALVARVQDLVSRCLPAQPVLLKQCDGNTNVVQAYSQHWPCVFPQHAAGKQHERCIKLETWQRAEVARAPWGLLRGLLLSDGCCFPNRTGRYVYWSYHFSNLSQDILGLFCGVCDQVGLEYRRYGTAIRINRRASVALLEEHVGRKT